MNYHDVQYVEPKRSTVHFCKWLESLQLMGVGAMKSILDLGAGKGANIFYMISKYPQSKFLGVDIDKSLVDEGNEIFKSKQINNCKLVHGDMYNLDEQFRHKYDGIISLQTLSWLPEFEKPIKNMIDLQPKWIALSSLFYDGYIDSTIVIKDYNEGLDEYRSYYYNIYSLKLVEQLFNKYGYKMLCCPFEIDIDIANNNNGKMGTFTEKLTDGRRLQISGPLLMSWYYIVAIKEEEL